MIIALLFFGGLAFLSLWAAWHDPDLRWIGFTLVANYAGSNLLWFFGSVASRPGAYTMFEIITAITAFIAWGMTKYRWLIALVLMNALTIVANIAFAMQLHPIREQINLHEQITNALFMLECLIASWVGYRDGVGVGRFNSWSLRRHDAYSAHGEQ